MYKLIFINIYHQECSKQKLYLTALWFLFHYVKQYYPSKKWSLEALLITVEVVDSLHHLYNSGRQYSKGY